MNVFRRWLERVFGLQTEVERQVEDITRLNLTLAGAVARAEVVRGAEAYATEVEVTHPHLAAAIRAAIAQQSGDTAPPTSLPTQPPAAALPSAPPTESPKSPPTKSKKAALPAPATSDRTTPTGGK